MSLDSAAIDVDQQGGAAGSGRGTGSGSIQAPRLVPAEYATWRPRMQTHLTRVGVMGAIADELDNFVECIRIRTEQRASKKAAMMATLFGGNKPKADGKVPTDEEKKAAVGMAAAREELMKLLNEQERAYAIVFDAIPDELQRQVGHIPRGNAFALWKWLENKYQSTERDNVNVLLQRWYSMHMNESESFDIYRSRVNTLDGLLTAAKEKPSPANYAFILLDRLAHRYSAAVLALKASGKLTKIESVNWDDVTSFINAFERSEKQQGAAHANDGSHLNERTMAARAEQRNSRPQSRPNPAFVRCFKCNQLGHYAANCPNRSQRSGQRQGRGGSKPFRRVGEGDQNEGQQQGNRFEHVSAAREQKNKYDALSDDDGETDSTHGQQAFMVRVAGRQQSALTWAQRAGSTVAAAPVRPETAPVTVMDMSAPAVASEWQVVPSPRGAHTGKGEKKQHRRHQPSASAQRAMTATKKTVPAKASQAPKPATTVTSPAAPKQPTRLQPLPGEREASEEKQKRVESEVAVKIRPQFQVSSEGPGVGAQPQRDLDAALASTAWGVDTMASLHISGNRQMFGSLKRCPPTRVQVADGAYVTVYHKGSIRLRMQCVDKQRTVTTVIDNVFYHERFTANLLSWGLMKNLGWQLHSTKEETHITTPGGNRINLRTTDRVLVLEGVENERVFRTNGPLQCTSIDDVMRLHERLGHVGYGSMMEIIKMKKTSDVGELNLSQEETDRVKQAVRDCKACALGKGKRTAFGHHGLDKGTGPLHTLHMDTFEVRGTRTDGGPTYGLVMVDPFTEGRWFVKVNNKDEIAENVIQIITQLQKQTEHKVRRLHCDGGSEFINRTLRAYLSSCGMELHYPPARTQQLNGVAERGVRSMKEGTTTMLAHAGVSGPQSGLIGDLWVYACAHYTYVWNRTHIGSKTGVTPYEVIYGRQPSIRHVTVFGCDVFFHIDRSLREGAFGNKVEAGVYLGHSDTRHCAVVYVLRTGKIVFTRDIDYRETMFTHVAAMKRGREAEQTVANKEYKETEPQLENGKPRAEIVEPACGADESQETIEDPVRFEVRQIVGKRERRGRDKSGGRGLVDFTEYEVKWAGYSETTWEPKEVLVEDGCQQSIDKFERERSNIERPSGRVARRVEQKQDEEESDVNSIGVALMATIDRPMNNTKITTTESELRSQMAMAVSSGANAIESGTPQTYRQATSGNKAEVKA